MRRATWVCFECREAVRRIPWDVDVVPCSKCGKACRYLGHKIPVPRKRDVRAWDDLRTSLSDADWRRLESEFAGHVRLRHRIEQEIERVSAKPKNPGRDKAVRDLKRRLAKLLSGE